MVARVTAGWEQVGGEAVGPAEGLCATGERLERRVGIWDPSRDISGNL